MQKKLIGHSISGCIWQILIGDVKEADVAKIISTAAFKNVDSVMQHYYELHWRYVCQDRNYVEELLKRLWPKIEQPRLTNPDYSYNPTERYKTWTEE